MYKFNLSTANEGFYDITEQVKRAVAESGVMDGICLVYCPHTTAGITINENCDKDVTTDLVFGLRFSFPKHKEYRHDEGNSAGHIKSSVIGASETLIIDRGQLLLGTWQSIYFAEFDPPRNRSFYVKIMPNNEIA